jgi:hypothetical protein
MRSRRPGTAAIVARKMAAGTFPERDWRFAQFRRADIEG